MSKSLQKRIFRDPNSRLTSEDIDNCQDLKTANEYLIYLAAAIVDADMQVGAAKGKAASEGEYMEPEKYQKLIGYRKVLGFLHQKTIFKIRELNEGKPQAALSQKTLHSFFMDVARKDLPAETFNHIFQKALDLKLERESAPQRQ